MKRRSLALFLAFLMAFGSILPVFATEPAVEAVAEEQTPPTSTYEDMYVQDGLMYRWDSYDLDGIDGTTLTMADKDGRDKVLELDGVTYNETYGVPETTKPIDFSSLITRTDGAYDEDELEFELVMTQTYYSGTESTNNRPFMQLGPISTNGSGALMSQSNIDRPVAGQDPVFNNIPSFGGYEPFYIGIRANANYETVTYYFDAEGNKVDAAVEGGTSVDVQYHNSAAGKNTQLCTQDWSGWKRYVGNYVGESYSIGAQMTFTTTEAPVGNMTVSYYRDAKHSNTFSNISYVHGADATYGKATRIVPETLKDAQKMAAQNPSLNHTFPEGGDTFKIAGSLTSNLKVGYYAFRLYNRHLTDAERQQNHFADLCSYYQIDNVVAYNALTEEHKAAIYTQAQFHTAVINSRDEVSNTSFEDVDPADLKAAIEEYVLIEEEEKKEAELKAARAAMYVQNGLVYRWDAYDLNSIDGTDLAMIDKDGRDISLELANVVYNSEHKIPETTSPIDFSSLVPRDERNAYLFDEVEFELVLTQTSYTGTGAKGTSPYINLGAFDYKGNAQAVTGWNNGVEENNSFGGYAGFYTAHFTNAVTTTTCTFDEGSVDVPYRQSIVQIAHQPTWSPAGRWFGNTIGQSYSVGAAMTFTLPENSLAGTMTLKLLRDRKATNNGWSNLSYVPGKTANTDGTSKIEPATYEEALAMVAQDVALNTKLQNKTHHFRVGGVYSGSTLKVGYHAFRLYNRLLTDAERQQNHFADLCNYHKIDNAAAYNALSAAHKAAIYTQEKFCAASSNLTTATNTSFDKVTKDQLEDAIDAQVLIAEEEKKEFEAQAPYAAMYVQDGLLYRWDAYRLNGIDGTSLAMIDKDGRDKVLTLDGVTYNSTSKTVDTTNPIDFSSLITRTNGAYDQTQIEFELILTQTSYTGPASYGDGTGARPYITLGPIDGTYSGDTVHGWADDNLSYGGYSNFYLRLRNGKTTANTTYTFDEGSVDVPYLSSTGIQFAQEPTWAIKRWFGNYVGQSYSVGAKITFETLEKTAGLMKLELMRDGLASSTYADISYVHGKTAIGLGTKIVPATYEEALAMSQRNAGLNSTFSDGGANFKIGGSAKTDLTIGYHAFRVYERHLTEAERMQNHFADLCGYYQIDNAAAYNALSDEHKAAIYTQAQFTTAVVNDITKAENRSFDDVTKDQLEDAIDAQVLIAEEEKANAEHVAKYENLAKMYVSNSTTFWSAFGAKQIGNVTIGVVTDGAALSAGTAVYGDGYLRVANTTLNIDGAYKTPANGQTLSYTTEFVYAGYDSGRTYTGENVTFNQKDYPAFVTLDAFNAFYTAGVRENLQFVDAESKKWHLDWSTAYAEALNDEAKRETFWTPVSSDDYTSLKNAGMNVREVGGTSGNEPIGAYSQTGYETDWAGFKYVIDTLKKTNWYQGYDYVAKGYEGVYNLNIMKNNWNGVANGWGWMAQYDYIGSFGPDAGNWSSYDFGVVNTHTWVETVSNNVKVADRYSVDVSAYSGNRFVGKGSTSGTNPSGTVFKVQNFDTDVYAIRIYPFALTDTERAQNHFADLASYYAIDNADAFFALSAGSKEALYKSFASTMIKDTDKATLENAIAAAAEREEYVATLSAESYVSFAGYQVRLHDYPGLRSVFEVYKNGEIANATLVEVGAIMAIKGDRTTEDLIVAKNESGVYEAVGAQMKNVTVYADKAWAGLYENGGKTTFGYTCTFPDLVKDTEEELEPADKLQTALLFRGYAVVEIDGIEFVLYTNMASKFETVSMYELSKSDDFKDYKTSQDVVAKVEG